MNVRPDSGLRGVMSHGVNQLQNVAEYIASELEKAILQGHLAPGERLVQSEIASEFGVSRLPVRDALRILERKQFVVSLPRKGVIVRTSTPKEISDLYELRVVLETCALERAIENMTPDVITALKKIVARQAEHPADDLLGLLEIDTEFHTTLLAPCENDELKGTIKHLWHRIKLLRAAEREIADWRDLSVQRHSSIIVALEHGDKAEAKRRLTKGIQDSRDDIIAALGRESVVTE